MDAGNEQPARLARRNTDETFRDVCNRLAWHNRTMEVNAELAADLHALDARQWHVERDWPIEGVLNPIRFIVFGPTGVFLLQASRGYWTNRDIEEMCEAADTLARAMIGYPDPVRCGIVMLDETIEHRQHFAKGGCGPCWIVAGELLYLVRAFRSAH